MILNGHCPLGWPHHASAGAIIQIDMGHLHTLRKGLGVHCIVVILRTDLNTTCITCTAMVTTYNAMIRMSLVTLYVIIAP